MLILEDCKISENWHLVKLSKVVGGQGKLSKEETLELILEE